MKIARHISIALLAVTATAAIYGAYHLITDPSGHTIGYTIDQIKSTPFRDYLIPGWLLLIFIGLGSVVSCGLAVQEEESYTSYIIGQGAMCLVWIAVQVIMLRQLSFLQIGLILIGSALLYTGMRIRKREEQLQEINL